MHGQTAGKSLMIIVKHKRMSTARVSFAEVFHPCMRWEGPGSAFESMSRGVDAGAAGGVWKSRILPPLGLRSRNMVFERLGS